MERDAAVGLFERSGDHEPIMDFPKATYNINIMQRSGRMSYHLTFMTTGQGIMTRQ